MRSARRARIGVVVLGLIGVACGGPRVPLEVGVKEFPSDVIIGAAERTAPAPIPVRQPRRQSLPPPPPPARGPLPSVEPRELCPKADPVAAPAIEAPNRPAGPPVEGTYYFRNDGTVQLGQLKTKVPPISTRTIENVKGSGGAFTYDVLDALTAITFSYSVDDTGLYLTKMVQKVQDQTLTFTPNPALRFAQYPLENGTSWSSGGVDLSSTVATWVLGGVVGAQRDDDRNGQPDDGDGDGVPDPASPKTRVDACGQWLDAWVVRITGPNGDGESRFVYGSTQYDVGAYLAYGTQFGGLGLMETWFYDGTIAGQEFHLEYTTTIAQVPAVPTTTGDARSAAPSEKKQ